MKSFLNFKNTFVALSMAALATTADAQVSCLSRGNFSLGTRVGFSAASTNVEATGSATSGGNTSLQLNLTPSIGYFFANNFNAGLGMDYLLLSSDDKSNSAGGTSKSSDSRLLFGPFMRYYIPVGDDQAFFIGGVSGFGRSKTQVTVDGRTQDITNNITSLGIGPGYTIFSNNCFALETQVKYNYGISRNEVNLNGVSTSTKTFSNAWDFVVGATYYFSR